MNNKELNKPVRPVHFYPGRLADYSYPAFPVSNMLIVGNEDSGVNTLVNSIIVNGVEKNSPTDLKIRLHDCNSDAVSYWSDNEYQPGMLKGVPHTIGVTNKNTKLNDILKEAKSLAETRLKVLRSFDTAEEELDYQSSLSTILFIIKDFSLEVDEEFHNLVEFIVSASAESKVYLILATSYWDSNSLSDELLNQIGYHICLKTDSRTSAKLIGSTCAATSLPKFGWLYLYDVASEELSDKMCIPFHPDTFIKKFVRAFSVAKEG